MESKRLLPSQDKMQLICRREMISCHNYVVIDTHIATETMTETTTGTTMATASSFPHSKNCQYYFCLENLNFVLILGVLGTGSASEESSMGTSIKNS